MNLFRCTLLASLLALAGCADMSMGTNESNAGVKSAASSPYKIVAYYIEWAAYRPTPYLPHDIDASHLTHLNFAFATIKDGRVAMNDPKVDTETPNSFAQMRELKVKYPHLRTLISVGGWEGSKDFSTAALDEKSRALFADSAVAFIRKHGFDGIDIDWEYPVGGGAEKNINRPVDKQNYSLLLRALREKLDAAGVQDGGRHYLLTSATGVNPKWLKHTNMREASQYVDWFNMMTYDYAGTWSKYNGLLSPLHEDSANTHQDILFTDSLDSSIALYKVAGVPTSKMVLGMAMYGYSWKKCGSANHGLYQDCDGAGPGSNGINGSLDFNDLSANYIDKNGYTRYWIDAAQVPYLYNPSNGVFVTYEDAQSYDAKLAFLKEEHLAGAMFWDITDDAHGVLLNRVDQRLNP